MSSTVRFDTLFDAEPSTPLGASGPERVTSGADPRVCLDHGVARGNKILARARVARILLGVAAPVDAPVRVRLEFRWDDDTDEWSKREGVRRSRSRAIPWSVAGRVGEPMGIRKGKSGFGEVVVPAGSVPPGGLLLLEIGADVDLQKATGLAFLAITVTPLS
jgi:hypothetical protein